MLSVDQAAEISGVSRATMYRRVQAGEVPAYRVGRNAKAPVRIRRDELEAFLFGPANDHEES